MSAWTRTLPLLFAVATTACPGSPATSSPPAEKPPRVEPSPPAPAEPERPASTVPDVRQETQDRDALARAAAVRALPALKDVEFQAATAGPFVVLQEVNQEDVRDTIRKYDDKYGAFKDEPVEGTTNPAKIERNIRWAAKAESFAQREATLLGDLDRRFRAHFAERFKLPMLQESGRCVVVVSMWNRKHFERVAEAAGVNGPKDARGRRLPESHDLLTYLGDEFLMSSDEIACAEGRWQKTGDQELLTLGARELLRRYAAVSQRRDVKDDGDAAAPLWFTWGLADWLAAVELPGEKLESPLDADLLNERIRLDHVQLARTNLDYSEKWKLRDLMKPLHAGDGAVLGERLAPGGGPGTTMSSLFRCRAWAFCHFLWNYDGGKHRTQLGDFLALYLAGEATSARFATEIMKRPGVADWGDVEMEFEWYWTQLLERKVGRTKVTHAWHLPTTTTPEGTVEQDETFLAYWKERTRK